MNEKAIRITGKYIDYSYVNDKTTIEINSAELLKHRADLEALLAKPEPQRLVKGAVCQWGDGNTYVTYDEMVNRRLFPLDWETLGYTIAQNYPEAKWFAVDKNGVLFYFTEEPEANNHAWYLPQSAAGTIDSFNVTLTPGVDWRDTKRRIERI